MSFVRLTFAIGLSLFSANATAAGATTAAPLLGWTDDPPAVEVRALSGSRSIGVRYGVLAVATFHAELDGDDVSALFHPEANHDETVTLPFIGGHNLLRLQASSADELEHITIQREISFARLPQDAGAAERLHSAPELKHELWKLETPEKGAAPANAPAAPPAPTPPTK